MSPMRASRLLLAAAALSLLAGCDAFKAVRDAMKDILELQQGISTTFGEPATAINISNDKLIVTFVNSRSATLPEDRRAEIARGVALYVREHYRGYGKLSAVQVGFTSKHSVGVVTTNETNHWYTFRTAELEGQSDSTKQPTRPEPTTPTRHAPAAPAKHDSTAVEQMPPPLNPS